MDLAKSLVCTVVIYHIIKFVLCFYLLGIVVYSIVIYKNEDILGFSITSSLLLVFVLISYYLKSKHGEALVYRVSKSERAAFVFEIFILLFGIIGYSVSTFLIASFYQPLEKKAELYFGHHGNQSLIVQINETSTQPAYPNENSTVDFTETSTNHFIAESVILSGLIPFMIDQENVTEMSELFWNENYADDRIGSTSRALISEAVTRDSLIFHNIKESSSKPFPPLNESNAIINQTALYKSCKELFEDFYLNRIIYQLIFPCFISTILQFLVFLLLGFSEYLKKRIMNDEEGLESYEQMSDVAGEANLAYQNEAFEEYLETGM